MKLRFNFKDKSLKIKRLKNCPKLGMKQHKAVIVFQSFMNTNVLFATIYYIYILRLFQVYEHEVENGWVDDTVSELSRKIFFLC